MTASNCTTSNTSRGLNSSSAKPTTYASFGRRSFGKRRLPKSASGISKSKNSTAGLDWVEFDVAAGLEPRYSISQNNKQFKLITQTEHVMSILQVGKLADRLGALKTALYQKDFLLTWERTTEELQATLLLAEALE